MTNKKYKKDDEVIYYFNGIYTGIIKYFHYRLNPSGYEYLINGFWIPEGNVFSKRPIKKIK